MLSLHTKMPILYALYNAQEFYRKRANQYAKSNYIFGKMNCD